jgi:ArsR family transcriptional regulator
VGLSPLLDLGDCVDMGAGDGALLDLIAPSSRSMVCIDDHQGMVEAGNKRLAGSAYEHVRFVQGDMHDPPLGDESADTVLFLQSLQYAAEPERALVAAARLLRPAGRCVVLTLGRHADQRLATDYGHRHLGFESEALSGWFVRAGLVCKRCELTGHDVRSPQLPILMGYAEKPEGDK